MAERILFNLLQVAVVMNPYGPMGASRTRMVGFLAEPVFVIVFFTVSLVADSTIPYCPTYAGCIPGHRGGGLRRRPIAKREHSEAQGTLARW